MTRYLVDALGADEIGLRITLADLERANGHPNTDIRFSAQLQQAANDKMRQLGLDPKDTTAEELYEALMARVKRDDAILTRKLRTQAALHVSAEASVTDGMVHELQAMIDGQPVFALKTSVVKTMLKKQSPKKALKALGYRSVDSFLKHEQPLIALAAAWLSETSVWQKKFIEQYKKLKPKDFETRKLVIISPAGAKWRQLGGSIVSQKKHNLLPFRELGALVVLPFPADVPTGAATVSLTLAVHEINELRACSTFLKLSQVRSDFGAQVLTTVQGQPAVSSTALDRPVPWHVIQRYYARLGQTLQSSVGNVFEPHIELADMAWHSVERALADIEPELRFWQSTAHLAVLHNRQPISFNILDVALNYCNNVPLERRIRTYVQHSMWHELLLSYLRHETVEHTVLAQLQPQLALEPALA